ncbi:MAG: cytochrome c3 family protein [Desulfurivibrionaceae bacterium]|jgi:predicted CXXCH cytochrome family protein
MLFFLNTSARATERTQKKEEVLAQRNISVNTGKESAPTEITLKTDAAKKPAVFPHAKHQTKNECDVCHKDANFPTDKNWDMKKGHTLCLGCHKAKNQGAVKCDGCHK